MAQNVGQIEYTIGADSDPLIKAEGKVSKSIDRTVGDFKRLETQQTKTTTAVKKGISGMGRSAGQAGIQLQQFIGQVQGGQDAMLALSQQSADLGFVLGAPLLGAVIGIGASLAGMLIPSLLGSSDATEELIEKLKELKEIGELTEAQQAALTLANKKEVETKKERIKEIDEEIKKTKEQIELNEKQQAQTGRAGAAARSRDMEKERESLVNLRAERDLLNQEIAKTGGATKEALEIERQAAKELEVILAARKEILVSSDADDPRIQASWNRQQILLATERQTFEEQKAILEENNLATEELIAVHEQKVTDIEKQGAAERTKIRDAESKATIAAQMASTAVVLGAITATTGAVLQGMDEQSGAYKVLFAIQKAAQIAMTIANAEAAAAAITAREAPVLGLGAVAAGNFVRGIGYASAGIIAGTAIAGGRQEGGPVNSTGMFRMGENNSPEILQTGAGLFGIPGDQGRVFNQSQLEQIDTGSNVSVNVVVENNAPSASVSTTTEDQGRTVRIAVNEVANQISSGVGPVARSLRQSTTTQLRGDR